MFGGWIVDDFSSDYIWRLNIPCLCCLYLGLCPRMEVCLRKSDDFFSDCWLRWCRRIGNRNSDVLGNWDVRMFDDDTAWSLLNDPLASCVGLRSRIVSWDSHWSSDHLPYGSDCVLNSCSLNSSDGSYRFVGAETLPRTYYSRIKNRSLGSNYSRRSPWQSRPDLSK